MFESTGSSLLSLVTLRSEVRDVEDVVEFVHVFVRQPRVHEPPSAQVATTIPSYQETRRLSVSQHCKPWQNGMKILILDHFL